MTVLQFHIDATDPASRTAAITLELDREAFAADEEAATELFLAAWTPGSYLLREYSRHLSRVVASDVETGSEIPCRKTTKNRFRLELGPDVRRLRVRYRVYAHELSVRTADFTDRHAYWNHACVLLWPTDRPELPCELRVAMPAGWRGACNLPETARADGSVTWRAADLDEAIDSPCLLGCFESRDFTVLGVPHAIVLDGLGAVEPKPELTDDLTAIVEAAAEVFGGSLPYESYQFQCLFTDDGYGGLEHRASTTLLARRTCFSSTKRYRQFLALCAHELFHVWNVKRMRPAELWRYDYERENYTPFLWLAEGWTAYYDDLLCLRAGLVSAEHYVEQVVRQNIERVLGSAGRRELSLGESSFDAWIRLYRPDENTRNSSQNYYVNGAVAAMCLDLRLRLDSSGDRCLDDVLQVLYAATYEKGRGYTIDDVDAAVRRVGGDDAVEALHAMVDGPLDPPLRELLGAFGIRLEFDRLDRPFLGITFQTNSTCVAAVQNETPAALGGLHPGDELLALDGLRVTSSSWREVFDTVARCDSPLDVLLARRGEVRSLTLTPTGNPTSVRLRVDESAGDQAAALRRGWLRARR